jgi:hypothetical protein
MGSHKITFGDVLGEPEDLYIKFRNNRKYKDSDWVVI